MNLRLTDFALIPLTFSLLLGGVAGVDAVPTTSRPSVVWVASSEAFGFGQHLQFEISGSAGSASLELYGPVVLGFDALYVVGRVAAFEAGVRSLSFEGEIGGQRLSFAGEVDTDVAVGTLIVGDQATSLTLTRLAPWSDDALGLYTEEGRKQLLTWREGGGLRLVDLLTGESQTLLPLGDDEFSSPAALKANVMGAPRVFNIVRDAAGAVVALNIWSPAPASAPAPARTLYPDGSIRQSRMAIKAGNALLQGTLLTPARPPRSIITMVHGSGPIYRTALVERAIGFVEAGHAVFVYDKRGVGESGGTRDGDDLFALADDLVAITNQLGAEPALASLPMGVQGHSQAGWVIPLAVSRGASIDFAVVVNGGGVDLGSQARFDKTNDLARAGYDEAVQTEAISLLARVQQYLRDRSGVREELERDYLSAQAAPWFDELDLPRMPTVPSWDAPPPAMLRESAELRIDPVAIASAMNIPVLVLLGADDETVPAEAAARAWEASFVRQTSGAVSRVRVIDGTGHNMRVSTPHGYALHPLYLSTQLDWIAGLLER